MLTLHLRKFINQFTPFKLSSSKISGGPYLFLHIPKTAGTSFRASLEQSLGSNKVIWDYGPRSPKTDPKVFDFLYLPNKGSEDDKSQLISELDDDCILAGHVPYAKYKKQLPPSKIITFIREPVSRVVSNYRHACRHLGFTGTLMEYAQQRSAIDALSRHLSGAEWSEYKFIGISECYDQSIELFNTLFGTQLRTLNLNKAPKEQKQNTQPTAEEIALLEGLNAKDMALYKNVREAFEKKYLSLVKNR